MSYEPTNWKSGDIVTSAKLNKLEQGVANAGGGGSGGVLIVNATETDTATVLDCTWEEIHEASVAMIVLDSPMIGKIIELVTVTGSYDGTYEVSALKAITDAVELDIYTTSSSSDYPKMNYD